MILGRIVPSKTFFVCGKWYNNYMKKISYSLLLVVFAGVALSVFWAYDRYFKTEESGLLSFVVERGTVDEVVLVRGEVVPQKDFDLEFPLSGTVERVYVSEGARVRYGAPLVKLETTDLEFEVAQLQALLAQAEANLAKLASGATEEDIQVSETKVSNSQVALEDANKNLANKLQDAYVSSDDAVRNKADQLFSNPRSSNPQINIATTDSQLKTDLEARRLKVEQTLSSWKSALDGFSVQSDLETFTLDTNKRLNEVREFLDRMALLVNGLMASSDLSQTTIDGYKSDISTARTNVNTAIAGVAAAEEKMRAAGSALSLVQSELALKRAPARPEDISVARASVREIESKVAITRESIRKSTLYAPGLATVEKIWLEEGEVFRPGTTVVSLSTPGMKIQSDVSELEIGKISDSDLPTGQAGGNDVQIVFDAFPRKVFTGKVLSIEPRKVVKDGDTYYKINVYLDAPEQNIRSGMSADLTVQVSHKENVLRIPEIAVTHVGEKDFVIVLANGVRVEREIEVGVSGGDNIEIISGVEEGDVVVVPVD